MKSVFETRLAFVQCKQIANNYLDIVLRELLCERSPSGSNRINRIVYRYLAIFMIQELIDVFSALLNNLLSQQNG